MEASWKSQFAGPGLWVSQGWFGAEVCVEAWHLFYSSPMGGYLSPRWAAQAWERGDRIMGIYLFSLHCVFFYVYTSFRCVNPSPGILSFCEDTFVCG